MRVIVLDNFSNGSRYLYHWKKYIPEMIAGWGYEVLVISGECNIDLSYYSRSAYSSLEIFKQMMAMINNDKLRDDDIILFANARDYMAISIIELIRLNGLKTKVAGFWQNGVYYHFSDLRKQIKDKELDIHKFKYFERALTGMYDYNLISTERQKKEFIRYYYSSRKKDNLIECGYPYSNLIEPDEEFVKEDIIVYNAGEANEMNEKAFEIIKNEFPEYQFFVCHTERFTDNEYRNILKRAKILFNTNQTESEPVMILEAMMYGAIPILPDFPMYDEIFPNVTTYDRRLLKPPYLKLIRGIDQIIDPIKEYMGNYDENRDRIVIPDRNSALEEHFNSDDLKEFLESVKSGRI